jgi:asparagine N-glycosylation enzyme membrane subunit Stt3
MEKLTGRELAPRKSGSNPPRRRPIDAHFYPEIRTLGAGTVMALLLQSIVGAQLPLSRIFLEVLPQLIVLCCIVLIAVGATIKGRRARSWPRTLMLIGSVSAAATGLIWVILGFLDYMFCISEWYVRHLDFPAFVLGLGGIVLFTIGYCWEAFAKRD